MDLGLKERVALVAGSSRGIGKAIVRELLQEGCRVCITGRNSGPLTDSRFELCTQFGAQNVIAVEADLTTNEGVRRACDGVWKQWRRLDSVVANVGNGRGAPNWNQSATEWEQLLRINLLGSVEIAQAATPLMIESGGGALVFISSIAGVEATAAPLAYSAAKAALINYSKNLSRALADKHIRVNCVAPGNIFFEGSSWDDHLRERREAVIRMIERDVPLRRFGTPEEIGSLVTFLCSEKASFITGACFVADGGQTRAC